MKRYNKDMLHGPLLGSVISYTVPIILASVLQLLFNAADLVVVGRFRGSLSVGAVGATGAITNLIVSLFIGMSTGAGVNVAHAIGSRDEEMQHRMVHTAVPVALIGGVILTAVGVGFSKDFLIMMGTPEDILPLSTVYMQVYFGGITFTLVYNFCSAILRAAGDTKGPLVYLAIAGVVNVLLNIVFIAAFGMNVEGVALATVISQALSAFLVVRALCRRTDGCCLELRKIKIYKKAFLKIVSFGVPAGLQGSMFSISNVLIQSSINSFGPVFMSGNAAAGNIEGFVYISMNAFSQTSLNYTGQNVGARQYERVKKILWICVACAGILGLMLGGLAYLFAPWLLQIYITDSSQAISDGILRMGIVCLPYFLCGMMDTTTGSLRGLGSSVLPMIISVLGVCVMRVGWIYSVFQIPQFHTPQGLLISYPISWTLTLGAQLTAFLIILRRQMNKHKLQTAIE